MTHKAPTPPDPSRPAFTRLVEGMGAEYRRLCLKHPQAQALLSEVFESVFEVAAEIVTDTERRATQADRKPR